MYDIRKSYNDVFIVDGFLYLANTLIFVAIPYFQRKRSYTMRSDYNQIVGMTSSSAQQHMSMRTVKVQRGSLGDDDDVVSAPNGNYGDYGTTNGKTGVVP